MGKRFHAISLCISSGDRNTTCFNSYEAKVHPSQIIRATTSSVKRFYRYDSRVGMDPTLKAMGAGNHGIARGRCGGGARCNTGDIGNFRDDVWDSRCPGLFCADIASISLGFGCTILFILIVGTESCSHGSTFCCCIVIGERFHAISLCISSGDRNTTCFNSYKAEVFPFEIIGATASPVQQAYRPHSRVGFDPTMKAIGASDHSMVRILCRGEMRCSSKKESSEM